MYLSQNIRYLRKKKGLSQEKLAELLGRKSYTTIQKWETGDSEPAFETVVAMSEIFGVNLNDIVYKNLEYDSILEDALSDQEQTLLALYRNLNASGKEELLKHAKLLSESKSYTANTELSEDTKIS